VLAQTIVGRLIRSRQPAHFSGFTFTSLGAPPAPFYETPISSASAATPCNRFTSAANRVWR